MKYRVLHMTILIVLALSLFLTACGGEEPTPTQAEEPLVTAQTAAGDPTAISSVQTGSQKTQVMELEQIVGTWIAPAYPGNFVLTVFPDGVLRVATSLEDLERGSTDSWNLTIEEGQIVAEGFALCPGDVGTYIGEIDKDGNLRFISLIDACDSRMRKMDRSLPGRLNEYILIYRPVN